MHPRTATAILVLATLARGTLGLEGAFALDAGVAVCDITPDVETYRVPMAGYGARNGKPSTGVHDPLKAKVLYFRDGDVEMALVTTDLRSITPEFKDQILEGVADMGFTRENLLVCASHNHSGPSIYPQEFWQRQFGVYDPRIVEIMSASIAQALRQAAAGAGPVAVGFAEKDVGGFTKNRRWGYDTQAREAAGEEPVLNRRLWVMRVDAADGKPKAIVVNFGTHPTLLGADNFEISAEWPGALQRELEQAFPGAVAFYTNGAEGDQAPAGAEGNTAFERVTDFGRRLAKEAEGLARAIKAETGLAASFAYAAPELGEPVFSEAGQKRYASMRPLALEALPRNAALQQFRIGGTVLAALPGEPVCEVGLAAEEAVRAAGARSAVIIGLANDYIGYILNAKEYAHGGYEVDSRSYYGPGLGDQIAVETGKSAAALFRSKE